MNSKKESYLVSTHRVQRKTQASGITQAARKKTMTSAGLDFRHCGVFPEREHIFSSLAWPRRQLGFPPKLPRWPGWVSWRCLQNRDIVHTVYTHIALSTLFGVIHSVACCCFVCYHVFLSHLQFKQNTVESKLIHDVRSSDSQKVCAASLEFGDATYATCGSRCDDVA